MDERRYDLDWLRISAFGLLILYHVGMFYVTWDWHVKSSRASDLIEPLMQLSSPWRLSLLFLVAGAASRFMLDKMGAWRFTRARMGRLWPPLLLAVFVIVPPQSYYEIVEALAAMPSAEATRYAGALDNFYVKYATGAGGWCDTDGCLQTPTYNHMWFVAYLILYTAALALLSPLLRVAPNALAGLIAGPWLLLSPWLALSFMRVTMLSQFGSTHDFTNDWYNHAHYFGLFLFGFAVAKHAPFFAGCVRMRWLALGVALCAWGGLQAYYAGYNEASPPPDWLRAIFRCVHEAQAWGAIVAALGFAHKHLAHADGPMRRLLTNAIFPFYLIHQTIIVVLGHHLDQLGLPLWFEVFLLIAAAFAGCWLFYLLGRALPPLRVWIGLPSKPKSNHSSVQAGTPGGAV